MASAQLSTAAKAPFRKLDKLDQATALRVRAKEIQNAYCRRRINKLLTDHPELVSDVVELLTSLGYHFNNVTLKGDTANNGITKKEEEEEESDPQKLALADETAAAPVTPSSTAALKDEVPDSVTSRLRTGGAVRDPDPANWVPHRYLQLNTCSVGFMVDLLCQIEPVAYSKLALQPITNKGKRVEKMTKLCEHLEFATGYGGDFHLRGDHRHIPTLVDFMLRQRDSEHRRARDLRVPGNWSAAADGVYGLRADGEALYVFDKGNKAEHEVSKQDRLTYRDGKIIELESLEIAYNYSASKACIMSDASSDTILILTLGSFGRKSKRFGELLMKSEKVPVDEQKGKRARVQEEPEKAETAGFNVKAELNDDAGTAAGSLAPAVSEAAWVPPLPPGVAVAAAAAAAPAPDMKKEEKPCVAAAAAAGDVASDDDFDDESMALQLAAAVKIEQGPLDEQGTMNLGDLAA